MARPCRSFSCMGVFFVAGDVQIREMGKQTG